MLPLNYVTGVFCTDEGGGIKIHGGPRTGPSTPFESIVSTQGVWPWGLFNIVLPIPQLYMFNMCIIANTLYAYPLSIIQLLDGSESEKMIRLFDEIWVSMQ